MHPPSADTVLIRHGEIGTKSEQVGRKMEAQLRENVAAILSDWSFADRVERERTRLYGRTVPERIEAVTDAVTDTFGVVSASPAVRVDPTPTRFRARNSGRRAARQSGVLPRPRAWIRPWIWTTPT